MDHILRTENLVKSFKGTTALNKVTLTLNPGKIYGLIGRNGAGKSSLMRVIAGLSYPSSGTVELFGKSSETTLQEERKRIGCMIENPSINLNLTAAMNMRYHRILRGIPNVEMEKELLELVGLGDTKKKKVKNFSLGMKQRLGIAIALLGNPEFLILDEPINGLDPIGVVEVRSLLVKLSEERHMTILISSHNLPELYQMATDYIFIHQGEIKKHLTLEELDECCRHCILIQCTDTEKLVNTLEQKLNTVNYHVMPDKSVRLYDYLEERELVARIFMEEGLVITNFSKEGDTLEDYFVSMVGGSKDA